MINVRNRICIMNMDVDNLEYAIERWNMETDFNYAEKGTNPMKQYFDEHNIHILDKFTDYFKN